MPSPSENAPRKVGRYEIREELGRGMMGVVYKAHDPVLGRAVALKTIRAALAVSEKDRGAFEQRFLTEARSAARVSHPAIVVVYDVGRDSETAVLYIALEYLVGRTLEETTAQSGGMNWSDALRIVAVVARALHHAHAQGVIHRDVKPANIMLLPSGEPKIMDFGIAKLEEGFNLTSTGEFFGTPFYMAPEQALGKAVDGRTDLFSLGSVAYTLLTGRRPFQADSIPTILARVAYKDPPPPSRLVAGLPSDLDDVLARAMAKSPDDRYPSGNAMAEDLEDILAGRPPRHRTGWIRPRRGEGTLVALGGAQGEELFELEIVPQEGTGARRRSLAAPLSLLLLVLGLAAATVWREGFAEGVAYLRAQAPSPLALEAVLQTVLPSPQAEPAAEASPAAGAPAADAAATAGEVDGEDEPAPEGVVDATGVAETLSAEIPAALPGPLAPPPTPGSVSAPGTEAPSAAQTPGPAPVVTTPPPSLTKGRLSVNLEHHLKSGSLLLWVDGKLVLNEKLDSRVTKKVVFFRMRQGSLQEVLTLSPGRHEVRAEVRSGKDVRTERISGTFKAGATKRLEIRLSRFLGKMSLAWK